jgi:hypothetical protein
MRATKTSVGTSEAKASEFQHITDPNESTYRPPATNVTSNQEPAELQG